MAEEKKNRKKLLAEIRGKDSPELERDIDELRKEQFQINFKSVTEQVSQTARTGTIRRKIAQIMTVLRQRELEAQADEAKNTAAQ